MLSTGTPASAMPVAHVRRRSWPRNVKSNALDSCAATFFARWWTDPVPNSLANTHGTSSETRARCSRRIATVAETSGTRWTSPFFVSVPGISHDSASRSMCVHCIPRTSPPRCPVRRRTLNAAAMVGDSSSSKVPHTARISSSVNTRSGVAKALAAELSEDAGGTRKVLERVPTGKFSWQPPEKSTTFGGLATHIAHIPTWVGEIVGMEELVTPADSGPPPAGAG